jgi:dTDP-4-dehydrorhamnose reductase
VKLLLTGPTGQVGSALAERLPALGEVIRADRQVLDLARPESIRDCVRAVRPQVIVNTAAYTAVDKAESDEAAAMAVNRDGPAVLGEEARRCGALVVHFSTDYVFDGEKAGPYVEHDATGPLNVYGRSKLAGERALQASGCRHLIFRTSWVYAPAGANFLLTMLRLAASGKPLRVVDDQFGAPTSALSIADAVTQVLRCRPLEMQDLFHMTCAGHTTWYGFACAIFGMKGLRVDVTPVPSSEYKTPALRPRNSRLDGAKLEKTFAVRLPAWEDALAAVLARL